MSERVDLYIIQTQGAIPGAFVAEGSVIIKTFIGVTRWHALGRAAKWARKRASRFVYVKKWSES